MGIKRVIINIAKEKIYNREIENDLPVRANISIENENGNNIGVFARQGIHINRKQDVKQTRIRRRRFIAINYGKDEQRIFKSIE